MAERRVCPRCQQLVVVRRVAPERRFSPGDMLFAAFFGVLLTLLMLIPSRTDAICSNCSYRWDAGLSPVLRHLVWFLFFIVVCAVGYGLYLAIGTAMPDFFGQIVALIVGVGLPLAFVLISWVDSSAARSRLDRFENSSTTRPPSEPPEAANRQ